MSPLALEDSRNVTGTNELIPGVLNSWDVFGNEDSRIGGRLADLGLG